MIQKRTEAQIRRSIMPDGMISFIDAQKYKILSRHLASHGLSFTDYRLLYGLPHDYPSMAPDLLVQRTAQAAANGIGTRCGRYQGRKPG